MLSKDGSSSISGKKGIDFTPTAQYDILLCEVTHMKKRNKTVEDRQQYVVKSNDLIRKTRYMMTAQQQKIVLFAISKIKPTDLPGTVYTLSVDEICKACGMNYSDGGYYYKAIKEDIKELTMRIWVKMPDGKERTVSWIGDAEIEPFNGTVSIQFHKEMEPFLFALNSHYTQFKLDNVLAFKNKYAIRLYEILRSFMSQRSIDEGRERDISFELEELREMLDVNSYPRWADFDRCVIKKAAEEINQYCDEIHIEYETYKRGRNIAGVKFIITSPKGMESLMIRRRKQQRL